MITSIEINGFCSLADDAVVFSIMSFAVLWKGLTTRSYKDHNENLSKPEAA